MLKYRGSTHGTGEYPFLIDEKGISVLPVTSVGLTHAAPTQRISSGVAELDEMMGGKGYYRGSSVLVTGTAGTGKTSLGAHFLDAACQRGERALFFAFEESPDQIVRNLRSIGIDLGRWVKSGILRIEAARPSAFGFEMHLVRMHHMLAEFKPKVVMMDPVSGLLPGGSRHDVNTLVLRMVDSIKARGATALFTSLSEIDDMQSTDLSISSLVDTWILLRNVESSGERNRVLYLLKSRGMAHSNQSSRIPDDVARHPSAKKFTWVRAAYADRLRRASPRKPKSGGRKFAPARNTSGWRRLRGPTCAHSTRPDRGAACRKRDPRTRAVRPAGRRSGAPGKRWATHREALDRSRGGDVQVRNARPNGRAGA